MSQSLASIVVHLIFSTKARQRVLQPDICKELYPYMAAIATHYGSSVYEIGGIEDHVHIMLTLPRTLSIAKLAEFIKRGSSRWIKTKHPQYHCFAWQNGY